MSENLSKLTPKQNQAVAALLEGKSIPETAIVLKVSTRTLYRWLEQENFLLALTQQEGRIIDAAARRLINLQADAIDTLTNIMSNAQDRYRLIAAQAILDNLLKIRDLRNTEIRLSKLEAALLNEEE